MRGGGHCLKIQSDAHIIEQMQCLHVPLWHQWILVLLTFDCRIVYPCSSGFSSTISKHFQCRKEVSHKTDKTLVRLHKRDTVWSINVVSTFTTWLVLDASTKHFLCLFLSLGLRRKEKTKKQQERHHWQRNQEKAVVMCLLWKRVFDFTGQKPGWNTR